MAYRVARVDEGRIETVVIKWHSLSYLLVLPEISPVGLVAEDVVQGATTGARVQLPLGRRVDSGL